MHFPEEFDQLYVNGGVPPLVEPSSATDVTAHVRTCVGPASTVGGTISCVTVTESLDEQPLAPITISAYVPGSLTEISSVVPKQFPEEFDQLNLYGGVPPLADPSNVTDVTAHVRS